MKKLLWALIILPVLSHAQDKLIQKGQEYFNLLQFNQALVYFLKAEPAVANSAQQHELFLQIAFCHSNLHSPIDAIKYYEKALTINPEINDDQKIDYITVIIESGNYQKAKELLLEMDEGLFMEEILLNKCEYALKNNQTDTDIILIPLTQPLDYSCFGVTNYRGRLFYLLHKDNTGSSGSNYLFVLDGISDASIEKLKQIDLPLNFSSPSYDSINKITYFSGNASNFTKYLESKRENQKIGAGGVNNLFIWSYNPSVKNDYFKILSFNNVDYSCTHPCITDGGNTMYFSSNMLGGYGGFDIYKVTKTSQGWGTPENLGRKINTFLNEGYPFYIDGYVYFSSDGHPGYGGLDIFRVNPETQEIENLGKPINSSFDDFSYIQITYNEGYFLTNRSGISGKDNIFRFFRK